MRSGQEEIVFFEAVYHNGSIPPPYNYEYRLQLSLKGRGDVAANYELRYRFRDELTEEEIAEEGFTQNDDLKWQGNLPAIWRKEVLNHLEKTTWPKDQKAAAKSEPYIRIFCRYEDGETLKAVPAETDSWDYFLQEIIQGIYELAQIERLLEIEYLEIAQGKQVSTLVKPVFHLRKATVEHIVTSEKKDNKSHDLSWDVVKDLLRQVYIPDYNYDLATPKRPSKPGKYIQPGDGFWFKLNHAATNPDPDRDALEAMVKAIKSL